MTATQPVPCSSVLKRPPLIIPVTPSTRLTSQSIPASKASRFVAVDGDEVVLQVDQVDLLGLVGQEDLASAPSIFIRLVPSPVIAFLNIRPIPPEPACSKVTSPW